MGILLPFLPRDERERGAMLGTIGPVWDGNEVWLVVAGGATFAAFPAWYATMFSGFYLALLLILVCLIVRVVSFEWREQRDAPRWRAAWSWANTVASIGAPFVWGVALANLVHGVPLNSSGDFTGQHPRPLQRLHRPRRARDGALFALHGATFLTLRTHGELRARAAAASRRLSVPVAVVLGAVLAWTVAVGVDRNDKSVFPPVLPAAAGVAALVVAAVLVRRGRSGWAFVATGAAAVLWVATIFTALYPRVLVSHPSFATASRCPGRRRRTTR